MRTVALLAATTVLALAVAELALRAVSPAWRISYPPAAYRPDLFEAHAVYGYRLHPSRRLRMRWPPGRGRVVAVEANAEGFRSARDLHRRDGRSRIVVLGDSMVFGPGVEAGERLTERLEALEPGWRVDNMGMIGWGPDLMLRAFEAEALDPPPAVAVMVLLSHDLYRVIPEAAGTGYAVPRLRLAADGSLDIVPYPVSPPWWRRLLLVQGLRYGWFRYTRATFPLNAAILERFQRRAETHGVVPAVVFVPGLRPRFDDGLRREFLAAHASRRDLAFLDLTGALAEAGGDRLYLAGDSHWNADGHAAAARALHPWLAALMARRPRAERTGPPAGGGPVADVRRASSRPR